MKIGENINFGSYKWKILDIKENRVLLITDEIIDQLPYHNKHEEITWENSFLRNYLNNDFYDNFSDQEKERILETINVNKANPWYDLGDQSNTLDKIFILSLEEMVGPYFNNSSHHLVNRKTNEKYWFGKKDENNILRRSTYLGYIWWYWVRTNGRVNTSAVYIHGDGNIGIQGNKASKKSFKTLHPVTHSNEGGIRPALWIKLT